MVDERRNIGELVYVGSPSLADPRELVFLAEMTELDVDVRSYARPPLDELHSAGWSVVPAGASAPPENLIYFLREGTV